ncbi:MAG: S9 family peptidase [Planctomycetes bacterium]|nr:S9 family peptidase [Planctomycetota bacterium]
MLRRNSLALITTLAVLFASLQSSAKEYQLQYPETRRVDQVDTYHGVEVADPYRWLEDDVRVSAEVADWADSQNQVTRTYLDRIKQRAAIHQRLTKLWNYERYSVPQQTAGRYFFRKNSGLQNQAVFFVADSYNSQGRVLLDPNTWSEDGTIALGATAVSDDGKLLAYSRKESGSDWSTIYLLDIDTGKQLPEKLRWTRWGNIVWNADSTGFFYTRYPEPEAGQQFQSLAINPRCCFHRLGDSQDQDQLVYQRPDHPKWSFWIQRTDDNRYLVMSISRSTDPQNQVLLRPVAAPLDSKWMPLVEDFENEFSLIGNEGAKLLFLTDLDAPTKRVVAMPTDNPGREHLTEVIPASDATLESVTLLDEKLVASYLRDVATEVRIFSTAGLPLRELELPGVGSAHGFGGRQTDTETFYAFTSYATPTSIFRYDMKTGKSTKIRAPQVEFDPDQYVVRQAFFESKDGTRVPILLSHRHDLKRDGKRPTLLYGYGGFNISLSPHFSVTYATWMEMGGIVAVPNLRGGGEYGEAWHEAGKKLNKQNVFDDFIAAAEWLIAEQYTSSEKLAIMGGSNGGLLVGAVMTQRPELFGACLPAVGVMDMLRYHQFTAGHFWRDEYGTTDDPEEFKALLAYSPYHNLRPGVQYPATMVTTADTDDRVVPMHSFKFGAALQNAQAGPAPVLLRIEKRAGHGAGTPISKRIDLAADSWAFLWERLGMAAKKN